MTPEKEKAMFYMSKLGKEGAIRQCLDEIGNSDTQEESQFYYSVKEEIEKL